MTPQEKRLVQQGIELTNKASLMRAAEGVTITWELTAGTGFIVMEVEDFARLLRCLHKLAGADRQELKGVPHARPGRTP